MVVIDAFTRACLAIDVARRSRARDALEVFADLMERHGVPRYIRSDKGLEMIAKRLRRWLKQLGTETIYIAPGSPWEIESPGGHRTLALSRPHHPAAQCAGIPSAGPRNDATRRGPATMNQAV